MGERSLGTFVRLRAGGRHTTSMSHADHAPLITARFRQIRTSPETTALVTGFEIRPRAWRLPRRLVVSRMRSRV